MSLAWSPARNVSACCLASWFALFAAPLDAQESAAQVVGQQLINDLEGGFTGTFEDGDFFGGAITPLGDLDGDGVGDVAVGAKFDLLSNEFPGRVWILFLDTDGTVKSHTEIGLGAGGFTGTPDGGDRFGTAVANLGDLDGDGVTDLAVGAPYDDTGGGSTGAVYILFLNRNGTVKSHQKLSVLEGGITPPLQDGDRWGWSLDVLGDLDGDGVTELAAGSPFTEYFSDIAVGAVWVLFLNTNGTVKTHAKIGRDTANFTGQLEEHDRFGYSVAGLGDFDGDGVGDLVAGAIRDEDGGSLPPGAVYLVFLNSNGSVKSFAKISATQGNFEGVLSAFDRFGTSATSLGDFDDDGVTDIAVGAAWDDDGIDNGGAVYLLLLRPDGSVKAHQKISQTEGGLVSNFGTLELFGEGLANLGDLNGDGDIDLMVGAPGDDDGGNWRGAAYVLFLDSGPWTDLGSGMAGAGGLEPRLVGTGTVVPDETVTLTLTDAAPDTTAWFVAGLGDLGAPFKGGVLVPDPDPPSTLFALPTGALGQVVIAGPWPAGVPPGFTAWIQYWIEDAVGPVGWVSSNAIKGTTP